VREERADLVEPAVDPEPRKRRVKLARQRREADRFCARGRPVDDVDDLRVEVALRCGGALPAGHCVEILPGERGDRRAGLSVHSHE
jgi:hypothetical protein